MAGFDAAIGDYVITLDGDLQNDPIDIPMMGKNLRRTKCRFSSRQ